MEKVVSVGKVTEIKDGRTQQNKAFAIVKILININNNYIRRTFIANSEYLINKIKQHKQDDIVAIESTIGKVVQYKNHNGETNYTINFHLIDINKINNNNYKNNSSYNKNKSNDSFEWNLDFLDNNEKI